MISNLKNKFENPNVSNTAISLIVSKSPVTKINRIIKVELVQTKKLNYNENIFKYSTFTVSENGYYNINTQLCLRADNNAELSVFQFGISDENMEEFGEAITSKVLNNNLKLNELIIENLNTFKYLEKDKSYIAWLNITGDNDYISYVKDYSHLFLLKV